MSASIETRRKLRAIRTLSAPRPDATAEERLKKIEDVASGKIDACVFVNKTSPDLAERLKRGQASRSPRNAHDRRPKAPAKPEVDTEAAAEKKRKKTGGRDRKESGGMNRSSDVNL